MPEDHLNSTQETLEHDDYPYCVLNMKRKRVCYSQQTSIILSTIVLLLFVYQIVFVWTQSFKYSMWHEKRLHIMAGCVVYTIRKLSVLLTFLIWLCSTSIVTIVYYFVHLAVRSFIELTLEYLHFWIAASAMLYYFYKTIAILPESTQM